MKYFTLFLFTIFILPLMAQASERVVKDTVISQRNKRTYYLSCAPAFLFVLIPTLFWSGGVLESEATNFIRQYTDDRTVLQKVFDPDANDFRTYQARELSYLIDYIDANFFMLLLKLFDITLFIPLSALISSLLIVALFYLGVRKTMPNLDHLTAGLLLLLFLTSFVFVSTMGLFYRSSKPVLAPAILALMFYVLRVDQKRSETDQRRSILNRDSCVLFFLATAMGLLDRQGFSYILIAFFILLTHYLLKKELKDLLIGSAAAAAFVQTYNMLIGPMIIHAANGYWPDFSYQEISLRQMASLPIVKAFKLLFDNAIAMLGGFRLIGYVLIIAITARLIIKLISIYGRGLHTYRAEEYRNAGSRIFIIYTLIVLILQVLMFALMIVRHPIVYEWVDHRYCYYTIGFLMTVLFGLALFINGILPRLKRRQRLVLKVSLSLIAISNLLNLGYYKNQMLSSNWFRHVYTQTELLKGSIQNGSPDALLDRKYEKFYHYHQRNRETGLDRDR